MLKARRKGTGVFSANSANLRRHIHSPCSSAPSSTLGSERLEGRGSSVAMERRTSVAVMPRVRMAWYTLRAHSTPRNRLNSSSDRFSVFEPSQKLLERPSLTASIFGASAHDSRPMAPIIDASAAS